MLKYGGQLCLDMKQAMELVGQPGADWSAAASKVHELVEKKSLVQKESAKSPCGSSQRGSP